MKCFAINNYVFLSSIHFQKKASWFPKLIVWNLRLFYVFIVLPPYVNNKPQYKVFPSLLVLTHLWEDLSV